MSMPFSHPANRVPMVTAEFWLIKLMAVTMGETAADYLAVNLGFGLTMTSLVMAGLLAVALVVQFAQRRYVPWAYWLAVVLISIVGTLVTDNLVDNLGVSLVTTTVVFSTALLATFALWFASEKTLSIHAIFTPRREAFYWLAIGVTFALGTAAGDLLAEHFGLGYLGGHPVWTDYPIRHAGLSDAETGWGLGVLDRLCPYPAIGRILWRSSVAACGLWRAWLWHHRHLGHVPVGHRGNRDLSFCHPEGRGRSRQSVIGKGARTIAPAPSGPDPSAVVSAIRTAPNCAS